MKMLLVFGCFLAIHVTQAVTITLPDWSEKSPAIVAQYLQKHKGEDITFTIPGEQTFSQRVKHTATFLYSLSITNIALKCAASLFGATALSYGFIAYFIYKVYQLIGKINAWLAWNNEVHHHDMIDEAKHYLNRSLEQKPIATRSFVEDPYCACLEEIKQEEQLIRLYIRLNFILKKYRMRFLFDYDDQKEQQLEDVLAMLTQANTLCKI